MTQRDAALPVLGQGSREALLAFVEKRKAA